VRDAGGGRVKALMLGWEFPPHISGGLGTACAGLVQGLSTAGVEVTFVVPHAHGDEEHRFARVLGCNDVELEEEVVESIEQPVVRSRIFTQRTMTVVEVAPTRAQPIAAGSTPAAREVMVESALSPYSGALEYVARLAALRSGEDPRADPRARAEVAELRTALLAPREEREVALERISRKRRRTKKLEFSGFYGPDLFGEVARYALCVAEIAAREDFDVVHAHDWMTYPAGIVAARRSGKPLVVHVHACEHDRSGDHIDARIRDIEQLGLDSAARAICVSHYTAGMLRRHYRVDESKLRVVHNAVTHREQVERFKVDKTIPEPIVLFLGRVTFQKGPDYFLEAAARVVKVEPNVKFVMVGSGDMWPKMVERAARMGLARHVHFTGFLRSDDVEKIYAMADIYVMPSVSEPFGISPLEAMALDVPVIVSRQSGVSEVLHNALKVDFWDVQEIANKILALLRFPALREQLTGEGRDEVRAMRWDASARLVRDAYSEVVG
jgi:glycosyltransferase involved in cell wall biosynthesis